MDRKEGRGSGAEQKEEEKVQGGACTRVGKKKNVYQQESAIEGWGKA